MKANELMLGNQIDVIHPKTKSRLINCVDISDLTEIENPQSRFKFKPIPINGDRLIKLGFKKETFETYDDDDNETIEVNYWIKSKSGVEISYLENEKRVNVYLDRGDLEPIHLTHFKYIHQIQNLHFILTNENINIK